MNMALATIPPRSPHGDALFEYVLLGDLCELLGDLASPVSLRAVAVLLDAILDELSVLEGDETEFEPFVRIEPWFVEFEDLRGDSISFYLRLSALRMSLEEGEPDHDLAQEIRTRLILWFDDLRARDGIAFTESMGHGSRELGGQG